MIVEYAAIAGAPGPTTPWPLVYAVAQSASMHHARTELAMLDAVSTAVSASFGQASSAVDVRERLQEVAFPADERAQAQRWAENVFAEDRDDGA